MRVAGALGPHRQDAHAGGAAAQRAKARQAYGCVAPARREAAHVLRHQLHQRDVQQHAAGHAVEGALGVGMGWDDTWVSVWINIRAKGAGWSSMPLGALVARHWRCPRGMNALA